MINIYTTYISKASKVPTEIAKGYIPQYIPLSLRLGEDDYHLKEFAPDSSDLWNYKQKNISFETLIVRYKQKIEDNIEYVINKIIEITSSGAKEICLICYEKDPLECHRLPLAEMLVKHGHGVFRYCGELEFNQ